MHVNDISRQQFSKIASRGSQDRMTLTGQGLVLGAGTLMAKLDDKALPIEADQERIWTLLSVAYGYEVPLAVLGSLRRVAKHWQGGDKSLGRMAAQVIGKRNETRLDRPLGPLLIALGAIVWAFLPAIFVLVKFAMEPAGRGCDEGPVTDQSATNARGDVVEEYIRACTGFGTVVDYSIVLQLRGDEKTRKLIEHDRLYYGYPKFRWINDDTLSIDLGKVDSVESTVHNVGSIRITYTYSMADTGWW